MVHGTVTWRLECGLFGAEGLLTGPFPSELFYEDDDDDDDDDDADDDDATAAAASAPGEDQQQQREDESVPLDPLPAPAAAANDGDGVGTYAAPSSEERKEQKECDALLDGCNASASPSSSTASTTPPAAPPIPYAFSPDIAARLHASAFTSQIYVNGFDRDGRAVVIYSPTREGECSVEESMLSLAYNLERALALSRERKRVQRGGGSRRRRRRRRGGEDGGAVGEGGLEEDECEEGDSAAAELDEEDDEEDDEESVDDAQYTFIVDLANTAGFSPPLKTVKASFGIMAKHFPMRSGRILLVHGGSMIQWLWRILEPIVDPRTREKVTIVSERDEEELMQQLFSPHQLERRFAGGKNAYVFDPANYIGVPSAKAKAKAEAAAEAEEEETAANRAPAAAAAAAGDGDAAGAGAYDAVAVGGAGDAAA